MLKWIKKLFKIVRDYDEDRNKVAAKYAEVDTKARNAVDIARQAERIIRERTDISADVHLTSHNPNQIIVTGRYRNADYVQVYTLANNELGHLIKQLSEMQRYGVVTKIDAPYSMKAVIEKEIDWAN